MDWQEIRGNILEEIREMQEKPLRQYLTERNINDIFFINMNTLTENLLSLLTDRAFGLDGVAKA